MPGMIVAPQPLATEEGAKVLMRGGNAIDAAVTCALVQSIIDPHSCGIGGYVVANIYLAGQDGSIGLDAPALAGAKVTESMWADKLIRPDPDDIEAWVKTAMDSNLALLAAEKAKEAARYGRSAARAGHLPTLDLQADYTDTDVGGGLFGERQTEGSSISVVVNLPLYLGGSTSSLSREAAANYQRSMDLYEQTRRATERQARNAYLTTISNISQVKALKQVNKFGKRQHV